MIEETFSENINFQGELQEVFFINDGVGNIVDGRIYLHKNLKAAKWIDLYEFIVKHEVGHLKMKSVALGHVTHDAWMPLKMLKRYFHFIFTNRGAWKQLLFLRWVYLPDQKETFVLFDKNRFVFTALCAGLVWVIFNLPTWLT